MKILLLEDDISLARAIERMLRTLGHDVVVAYTLRDARKFLQAHDFDCVVLDTEITSTDEPTVITLEFAIECRASGVRRIIGMSGNEGYRSNWQALHALFIVKPFSLEILSSALCNA